MTERLPASCHCKGTKGSATYSEARPQREGNRDKSDGEPTHVVNATPNSRKSNPARRLGLRSTAGLFLARLRLGKPSAMQSLSGNTRQIRLDVEYWGLVQHIDAAYVQIESITPQQFHDCQADRVWTPRRARREHAMRTIV